VQAPAFSVSFNLLGRLNGVNGKASPPTAPDTINIFQPQLSPTANFMYLIVILLFPHVIASEFLLKHMLVLSCTLIPYLLLSSAL
jgi:hypothetical protein